MTDIMPGGSERVKQTHVGPSAAGATQEIGNSPTSDASNGAMQMAVGHGLGWTFMAGLAVWGILEASLPLFELPADLRDLKGNLPAETMDRIRAWTAIVAARNTMFSLAVLAFGLGLVLTVVEHWTRRRLRLVQAVLGGLLVGVIAGAIAMVAAIVGGKLMESVDLSDHRLIKTVVVQCGMLSVLGLGIGMAMGLVMFHLSIWKTCVIGCLMGGLLAAFLFPILTAVLLPNVKTDFLVPEPGVGRFLWIGIFACSIGLTVTGLGKEKKPAPSRSVDSKDS